MRAQLDQRSETRLPSFSVAVKQVKRTKGETSSVLEEELLGEAVIMAQFVHKNVVGLHGVVIGNGECMIVMQLCERGSVRDVTSVMQRNELLT